MPDSYNPTAAAETVSVDIEVDGDTLNYIVTAFSDSGASPVGPDFSNSDGSYRGARRVKGAREASMTIEIETDAQPIPPQFTVFPYKGNNWAIFQPAKALSNTAAGTYTLSLRCTDIPGTVTTLTIGAGGTGYTSGALTFTGGGGTGATGTFVAASGVITSVTLTNPGRGYATAPTVGFSGAGSGASVTAAIYTEL